MQRYKREIEGGFIIDLTNGINPYIGKDNCAIIRNRHSFKLLNGIPGTGIYTQAKSMRADSFILAIIAVMIIAAFVVLTLALIHANYHLDNLFLSLFAADNLIYTLLFIIIGASVFVFVKEYKNIIYKRYLKYLEKLSTECNAVESSMESASGIKYDILSHYRNCLEIEKELAEAESILSALEESYNAAKYNKVKQFYIDKVEALENRLMENRFKADHLDDEGKHKFQSLCECFEILFTGARFWDVSPYENPFHGHPWKSAIFGTGTFDYVLSESYPPYIKTISNEFLFIYSEYLVFAKGTTDFDVHPLKSIHMEFDKVPGHPNYGYLRIPELNLGFTTSDPLDMEIFVKSFEAYKNGTYDPETFKQIDSLTEEVALYCIMNRKVTSEMIQNHFYIGRGRTRRLLRQLSDLGIISDEDRNGIRELIIWDIEKVRELIDNSRQ